MDWSKGRVGTDESMTRVGMDWSKGRVGTDESMTMEWSKGRVGIRLCEG